jgi:pimeloyl-ACP methyl ester carboxylesterase
MPFASAQGASLYYEETGTGTAIVFAHEYASDCRGWESQVRYFSREHRCVAFNARGYPPSDVPSDDALYGQDFAAEDIAAVADHLGLDKLFVVGLSMGAAAALHFTMRHPERVMGLVFASGGSGSDPAQRERFVRESNEMADLLTAQGIGPLVEGLSCGATRVQLLDKDPRGWAEFRRHLSEHSVQGSALTVRNYQGKRPSIQEFEARLRALTVPTLIVAGDEDDPVIETSLFLKRTMPASGMVMFAKTGHAVNLEEPAGFNAALKDFFGAVERGHWGRRNPLARANRSAMVPGK